MPEPTLTALEFPQLLRVVQTYALSDLGRDFLGALKPLADLHQIQAPFRQIQELRELQYREGPIPFTDFPRLTTWLTKASRPGQLTARRGLQPGLAGAAPGPAPQALYRLRGQPDPAPYGPGR